MRMSRIKKGSKDSHGIFFFFSGYAGSQLWCIGLGAL